MGKLKKITLLILFLFVVYSLNRYQYNSQYYSTGHTIVTKYKALTLKNVRRELNRIGVKHTDIVMKQVRLETGNLKHVKNNNLFGFRGNDGYLKFNTWQDAVQYKKEWQDKRYKGGNYYEFLLEIGYASDTSYINKLKQFK
jgi:flagellum-specific peptidoglycan hydrolase FlgJ